MFVCAIILLLPPPLAAVFPLPVEAVFVLCQNYAPRWRLEQRAGRWIKMCDTDTNVLAFQCGLRLEIKFVVSHHGISEKYFLRTSCFFVMAVLHIMILHDTLSTSHAKFSKWNTTWFRVSSNIYLSAKQKVLVRLGSLMFSTRSTGLQKEFPISYQTGESLRFSIICSLS